MELQEAKKIIKKLLPQHYLTAVKGRTARRYYRSENDILYKREDSTIKPMHSADNRVCSSFYSLLVNQKAGYIFTRPPIFDTGDKLADSCIKQVLGDGWAKMCKSLCIRASNYGVAWLHYYYEPKFDTLKLAVLDGDEVVPIYSGRLERELIGALRVFERVDDESGKRYSVYQIWNESECAAYECELGEDTDKHLCEFNMFKVEEVLTGDGIFTNIYKHDFKKIPFIPFFNNDIATNDLECIKGLIDTYDKTYSGFANDLEDIQEVIMVLTGYEGESLSEFLGELKRYKTIKLSNDEGAKLQTLTIDIPVEAREKLLTMTRRAIFEQGQGVDPQTENLGNSSGVALKYLYSLLELKAGLTETEFRIGFGEMVRAICDFYGIACGEIKQIWTRTRVDNDVELADIAVKSVGIIEDEIIKRNHPWTT
jgi:SPP1 family phage portal protein